MVAGLFVVGEFGRAMTRQLQLDRSLFFVSQEKVEGMPTRGVDSGTGAIASGYRRLPFRALLHPSGPLYPSGQSRSGGNSASFVVGSIRALVVHPGVGGGRARV
jgi:hypothetical protein